MRQTLQKPGAKAGTARLSGVSGLVFRIGNSVCYLPPHGMQEIRTRGTASIVSGDGDRIGKAWLSPLLYPEKQDITLLIGNRLFSLPWMDAERILAGKRIEAPLRSASTASSTTPEGYPSTA